MEDQTRNPALRPLPPDEALAAIPSGEARRIILSRLVSEVYLEAEPAFRARLLECLSKPLGLVAAAAGALGLLQHPDSWGRLSGTLDDAVRVGSDQVIELARLAEQAHPEALRQLAAAVAANPVALTSVSGALLLVALRLWLPGAVAEPR
jgi:hypothetical protein